jgi:translation initiation factor IF-3
VIDADGAQVGVIATDEAIKIARSRGLDLVEVAPQATPPVCRVMDFGKYKYQMGKKQAQKKTIEVKEVKVRPNIGAHDLDLKIRNMRRFLDEGNKAKITMYFRGREIVRPELGMKVFDKIKETLPGKFSIEQNARLEANHITMVIAPK